MLKLSHVKKTFNKGTVTEKRALTGVDLTRAAVRELERRIVAAEIAADAEPVASAGADATTATAD